MKKICAVCGKVFVAMANNARYCSERCYRPIRLQQMREAKRRRRERLQKMCEAPPPPEQIPGNPHTLQRCVICGKPFPALHGQRVCSGVCAKVRASKDRPAYVRQISPEAEALARYVEEHY